MFSRNGQTDLSVFWNLVLQIRIKMCTVYNKAARLCEALGFVVERINHFSHALYCLQCVLVGPVDWRLVKDYQYTFTLVENACRAQM